MRTRLLALAVLLAAPVVQAQAAPPADGTVGSQRVCTAAPAGFAACHAQVRTRGAKPDATTSLTSGYTSKELRAAYNLTTDATTTVAVVDAYAHPAAKADLDAYRAATGLPALTTGQYTQVNQTGGAQLPSSDVGWGQEQMLDLEMVSAICPSCKILYVGGNSPSFADLSTAVNTAVSLGAKVVSNSYGATEFSGASTYAAAYDHPGVAITVSSGDNGYGVELPAAYNTVTAVGGTNLKKTSTGRGWAETAWTGAGSGCSAYVAKVTTVQKDTGCSRRTVADVSAVADPATGVAVYDSYGSTGGANWYVFGGTSVAAPIIGGVYGLAGPATGQLNRLPYLTPTGLYDVTSGSNGRCVRGKSTATAYLCTAGVGFDGPTGLGTPNGLSAF